MDILISIIIFLFTIAIGLICLFLILGMFGFATNKNEKTQKKYIHWMIYSIFAAALLVVVFFIIKLVI